MADIIGTSGNDTLFGTEGDDTISGLNGDDRLYAGPVSWPLTGGANLLDGGNGNDTLDGGLGNDTLFGGADNDQLFDLDGNDHLDGGDGDDFLSAVGANSTLLGGLGSDSLSADGASGYLDAGDGDDYASVASWGHADVYLGNGDDYYIGANGTGVLDGGAGRDVLERGGNYDLSGLTISGFEVLVTAGDTISATASQLAGFGEIKGAIFEFDPRELVFLQLVGAGGVDLSSQLGTRAVSVTASNAGNAITTGVGGDTLTGGAGNDTLDGADGDDLIEGHGGDDSLTGALGNDTIYGGDGTDVIYGGDGNDLIDDIGPSGNIDAGAGDDRIAISYAGAATIDGGAGRDVLQAIDLDISPMTITNVEVLETSGGIVTATVSQLDAFDTITVLDDPAYATTQVELQIAGGGAIDLSDELAGRAAGVVGDSLVANNITTGTGDDQITGGTGNDTLTGGAGSDFLSGGEGNNQLFGGDGDDTLFGEFGSDAIYGADLLDGGDGDDFLWGQGGADTLIGGMGNDTLDSDPGTVLIDGGDGNDLIYVNDPNAITYAGAGDDTVAAGGYGFGTITNIDGGSGRDVLNANVDITQLNLSSFEVLAAGGGVIATVAQFQSFSEIVRFDGPGDSGQIFLDVVGGGTIDFTAKAVGRDLSVVVDASTFVTTGSGNDVLFGSQGNDTLDGGDGNDDITGYEGDDVLFGRAGDDTINGEASGDTVFGVDTIFGGDGNDLIFDQGAGGSIDAGAGDDRIVVTYTGAATVDGGSGRDVLQSGNFDLTQMTISNVEVLETAGGQVIATASQLSGFSTITVLDDPAYDTAAVQLQLAGGGAVDLSGKLGLRQVTVVASSAGNTVVGGSQDDQLTGMEGNDSLVGGDGNDSIFGNLGGNDTLVGGLGDDFIQAGTGFTGTNLVDGGDGNDQLFDFGSGSGTVLGGAGDDLIQVQYATGGTVDGGTGRDRLWLTIGDISTMNISGIEVVETGGVTLKATVSQLAGFQTITVLDNPAYDASQVLLQIAGSGAIDLSGLLGQRAVQATASDLGNAITGGIAADELHDGDGDDLLDGGLGNDSLFGYGTGNDTLNGGGGDDFIQEFGGGTGLVDGGTGNDQIEYHGNNGTVQGGDGDDRILVQFALNGTVDGGAGRDVLQSLNADLTPLAISNVEVLETAGQLVTATAAQFDSFGTITVLDDPAYALARVDLRLAGGGTVDLSDELAGRAANVFGDAALANIITTGTGDDQITGGTGNDSLSAGSGDDVVTAGSGDDVLRGGLGVNVLDGGDGDDFLIDGELRQYGTSANGQLYGGAGNDGITTTNFIATIDGGSGIDTLFAYGDDGDPTVDISGLTLTNIEVLETNGALTRANVAQLEGFDTIAGADFGNGIELSLQLVGSGIADLSDEIGSQQLFLYGSSAGGGIVSGSGHDNFRGDVGNDYFDGRDGNDGALGGDGDDTILGGSGLDFLQGDAGNDLLDGGLDYDIVALSGNRADYSLAGTAANFTATFLAGPTEVDTLIDIEAIQFADGTFTLAQLGFGTNGAPIVTGPADLGSMNEDGTLTITLAGLLAGASDPDNDTLSVTGLTASAGLLQDDGNGTWTYTPPADFNGAVSFSYQISDGQASVAQTAGLSVAAVNDAPTVGAPVDLGASGEDGQVVISAATLLTGASDADGDTLSISGLSASAGTVNDNGNGTWTYTPPANFNGSVTFSYLVTDGSASVAQTAGLNVTPANDAPVANADLASGTRDQALNLTAASLLANDSDVDTPAAQLSIGAVLNAVNGTVVLNPDGSVTFTPAAGFTGTASFEYQAFDGSALSAPVTVTIDVQNVPGLTLSGNGAANNLAGGAGNDTISGNGGNDTLSGAGGDDLISGGSGNDSLDGGDGNDAITYGVGPNGFDAVAGGLGTNDRILATAAGVTIGLSAFSGIEVIDAQGFAGVRILGSSAADSFNFSAIALIGLDAIDSGSGNDTVTGSNGADTIIGGAGNDLLDGGGGDDTFRFGAAANGSDTVSGGAGGNDRITAAADNTTIGLATFSGIEVIDGGGFANVRLTGTSVADSFDFSGVAVSGIAAIDAGSGNDTVLGSNGNDTIIGGRGNDSLSGGGGDDLFLVGASAGVDSYDGGLGADRIEASANNVVISMAAGSIAGIETIASGGFAGLTLAGTTAGDALDFSGTALLGVARITGGNGNDTITGSAGADLIEGGAGSDLLAGGLGADVFDFNLINHSRGATADRIADFSQAIDLIDLSTIDADGALGVLDTFQFVGTAAFSGVAGQLRYDTTTTPGVTRILADLDGNRTIDMEIRLDGTFALTQGDFVL